ncbi:hypothetical protein AB0D49_15270 [Streptomyces sp. NPDC048290]|uniref:hypothetical protein n=1 Tax=Streptomyces sp. NPDC048290 TaxID=3155811 RepID=UPI00343FF227
MPADEAARGTHVEGPRVRTGPRHAAPRKPLLTRIQLPAGKAIALAAMPTAVLMGMGFTPKLALAEDQPASRSLAADDLTAQEYEDCVTALEDAEKDGKEEKEDAGEPSPSATEETESPEPTPTGDTEPQSGGGDGDAGEPSKDASAPDSGSGDETDDGTDDEADEAEAGGGGSTPAPTPSGSTGGTTPESPAPSPSQSGGGLLDKIGDAIEGVVDGITDGLTGGGQDDTASPSPTPSPSQGGTTTEPEPGPDPVDPAPDPADPTGEPSDGATASPSPSPSTSATATPTPTPTPSASETTDLDGCPVATDDEGGVDNKVPVPDDPWYLGASSLLLKGADYQGIVEVKTASGVRKKVLKYVVSNGTDIGDLHQTVIDPQAGATYHVQAAEGSTSTIRKGQTVMYTEKISGKLLGLVPVEFSPEHPPPLNIPLIYFTDVTVVQAAQFGGELHIPGMRVYTTD